MSLRKQICTTLLIMTCQFGIFPNDAPAQETDETTTASPLSGANFNFWRSYINASDTELEWQNLPWKMSFHEGLKEGTKLGKPVLLWAMNGHPLGCT
jgi:hypothetical protein